jgi:hypothetical protein
MAGRYDLTEPDAVERELAAMFPWASHEKLHAAAEVVHKRLDFWSVQPAITEDMLDTAAMAGVEVARLVGPAPVPGGSREGDIGPIGHLLRRFPGLRHGGGHEPPTSYA